MTKDFSVANSEYLFEHGCMTASGYPGGLLSIIKPKEASGLLETLAYKANIAADELHYKGYDIPRSSFENYDEFVDYYRTNLSQNDFSELRPACGNICIKASRYFRYGTIGDIYRFDMQNYVGFEIQHRNRYTDSGEGPIRVGAILSKVLHEVDIRQFQASI